MILPPGSRAELDEIHMLRRSVFVVEQGVDPELERDDLDDLTWHAYVVRDGQPVATGRLLDPGGDLAFGRVSRMAVDLAWRGRGLGRDVLRQLEGVAAGLGLVGLELHAQLQAAGFYERAGYARAGGVYLEADMEHVTMGRSWLPGLRPICDQDSGAVQRLIGACWAEYDCVLDLDTVDSEEPWMRAPASSRPQARMWVLPGPGPVGSDIQASVAVSGQEIKQLYVAAGSRRRGTGAALVRLGVRCGATRLWSDSRFTLSHRLYERLGWRRTGASRDLGDRNSTTEWEFALQP